MSTELAPADPRVAEPFAADPAFWRSVCASADALLLLVVAIAAAVVLRVVGVPAWVCVLPFAVPAVLLVRAGSASARFHRGVRPRGRPGPGLGAGGRRRAELARRRTDRRGRRLRPRPRASAGLTRVAQGPDRVRRYGLRVEENRARRVVDALRERGVDAHM